MLHCISRFDHTIALAKRAAHGAEPELAAHYIVDTYDDLAPDVRVLRSALAGTRSS